MYTFVQLPGGYRWTTVPENPVDHGARKSVDHGARKFRGPRCPKISWTTVPENPVDHGARKSRGPKITQVPVWDVGFHGTHLGRRFSRNPFGT